MCLAAGVSVQLVVVDLIMRQVVNELNGNNNKYDKNTPRVTVLHASFACRNTYCIWYSIKYCAKQIIRQAASFSRKIIPVTFVRRWGKLRNGIGKTRTQAFCQYKGAALDLGRDKTNLRRRYKGLYVGAVSVEWMLCIQPSRIYICVFACECVYVFWQSTPSSASSVM